MTLERDGEPIDAVVQTTKAGYVYVFERATGKPVFPIEERPVPGALVEGQYVSKTQPFPTAPPPYTRQRFDLSWLDDRGEEFARRPSSHDSRACGWARTTFRRASRAR